MAGPFSLLAMALTLAHLPSVVEGVLCYITFDEVTGTCTNLLADNVDQKTCCLNTEYCFKKDKENKFQACRPASMNQWSPWSDCTVSCLEGVQQRRRRCYGQGECDAEEMMNKLETRPCIVMDCCAQAGGWSEWSPWGPCSVTCTIGTQVRRRTCTNPAPICGGEQCMGSDSETSVCDTHKICPTHGGWGPWGAWGSCSTTCQVEHLAHTPFQTRQRVCDSPLPSMYPPGKPCEGKTTDQKGCTWLPFCAVDGAWGKWQRDGSCSVTCGIGKQALRRKCDSPAPKHGGKRCEGDFSTFAICNTDNPQPCPIDGKWTEWSEWSECIQHGSSRSPRCRRFAIQQNRTRSCVERDHGGVPCSGLTIEVRYCYNINRCTYTTDFGTWSEWSPWNLCHPPCGAGAEKIRTRKCQPDFPDYPKEIGVAKKVPVFFWGVPFQKCEALENEQFLLRQKEPCKNVPACTEDY
ncbi:properdin-like isoform X1 [Latimeria chalumnae]|uniref:properdin-like isoform X1 n=1 Tax=Latimeria chalumnae TaxID=7897 RepID=UPI00313E2AB9